MSRIAFVNGRYVPNASASVSVEDRGFQFADAVYEVCAVRSCRLIDEEPHFRRLERSLGALNIRWPICENAVRHVVREVVRRNRVCDGLAYVQISRGQARRDHAFPAPATKPTIVVMARELALEAYDAWGENGLGIITTPESRWARCDIKTTGLLPNVLAKQLARSQGAFEAWFVDCNGSVTEGASTSAFIVDVTGVLRTRELGASILPGVTRDELLSLCRQLNVGFAERAFTVGEAKLAREAFATAASFGVLPVTSVDGQGVGSGRPGPITKRLRHAYWSSRLAR